MIISSIFVFYFTSFENFIPTADDEKLRSSFGAFGSFFGGILGLIIGLISIILIYKTGQTTKIELKETKKEMSIQTFDNHFFQILAMFNNLIETLEFEDKGKDVISKIPDNFIGKEVEASLNLDKDVKGSFYNQFFKIDFSYINLFIQLLSYIDNIDFIEDSEEKKSFQNKYLVILKSIVTPKELCLLMHNHNIANENICNLFNKYSIFEMIDKRCLQDKGCFNECFKKNLTEKAFGNKDLFELFRKCKT